jgi:alpha-1,4-digalacturonate transport system substrate-binding protein
VPAQRAALGVFSNGVASLATEAFVFQGYKYNRAIMLPTVTRVTQAIVGEMSTDEAINKLNADMVDAVKQATK